MISKNETSLNTASNTEDNEDDFDENDEEEFDEEEDYEDDDYFYDDTLASAIKRLKKNSKNLHKLELKNNAAHAIEKSSQDGTKLVTNLNSNDSVADDKLLSKKDQ